MKLVLIFNFCLNLLKGEYREGEFLLTPMLKIKLVEKDGVVEFSPPLEETKQKIIFCLKHIVENTHNFPRIEKELFPELRRNKQMVLLPGNRQIFTLLNIYCIRNAIIAINQ